jgi:hypothetical protein
MGNSEKRRTAVTAKILVGTRKGLFVLERSAAANRGWRSKDLHFLGDPVSMVLPDRERGWFTALNLGHFGVKLHRSQNDGKSWDEYRVPVDERLVVSRTRDGGQTFEILSQGLPKERSYDLVYRHAIDIDPSGETLAFGSTTGSLWISESQGDLWSCISTHLPPIYCLRFVP